MHHGKDTGRTVKSPTRVLHQPRFVIARIQAVHRRAKLDNGQRTALCITGLYDTKQGGQQRMTTPPVVCLDERTDGTFVLETRANHGWLLLEAPQ